MWRYFYESGESGGHKRQFGLDLIRACSIVMVFLAHSTQINPWASHFPFGLLGTGVEAFFVLSGFLIGRIILRTLFSPQLDLRAVQSFWLNRWLRTLPAYFFTLGIYYALGASPHNSLFYWFFAQNLITPIPDFFVHSWSLAVEEWFYLTFPLLLLLVSLCYGKQVPKYKVFLITLCLFIVVGIITKSFYHFSYQNGMLEYLVEENYLFPSWKKFISVHGHWDNMRKIVPFRLDAIAYGCFIAYLMERFPQMTRSVRIWLCVLGVVGLTISFWFLLHTVVEMKLNYFSDVLLLPLFSVSFALLIPLFLICPEPNKRVSGIVTLVSKTSYSFYLIHFLVLDSVMSNLQQVGAGQMWIVFLGVYFLTLLLSYCMYRLIEIPFLNYRKRLSVILFK